MVYPLFSNYTCYSKYCDQAVCQGQVHEQGGGPLLPHPLPHQGGDGEGVAYHRQDNKALGGKANESHPGPRPITLRSVT